MPCCTLTAFLLSQLGIAAGAVKVRFFGGANFGMWIPEFARLVFARWRWSGIIAALSAELLLAGAAAPYVVTHAGRTEAAHSFVSAWHICTMGASYAQNAFQRASR
jgi:hypothetical protein